MIELERVLRRLKTCKARDFMGFSNVMFKEGIIGKDLKKSLLILINNVLSSEEIPEYLKMAIITMIAKQGSKRKLRNRRGIFLLAILRGIIMKMVYDRNYDITEKNLTQFNVGGRKKMSARNNLFAIINEEA